MARPARRLSRAAGGSGCDPALTGSGRCGLVGLLLSASQVHASRAGRCRHRRATEELVALAEAQPETEFVIGLGALGDTALRHPGQCAGPELASFPVRRHRPPSTARLGRQSLSRSRTLGEPAEADLPRTRQRYAQPLGNEAPHDRTITAWPACRQGERRQGERGAGADDLRAGARPLGRLRCRWRRDGAEPRGRGGAVAACGVPAAGLRIRGGRAVPRRRPQRPDSRGGSTADHRVRVRGPPRRR
jgi:hypothetical protein